MQIYHPAIIPFDNDTQVEQNKLKCQTGRTGEASHSFIHSVILREPSTLQLK